MKYFSFISVNGKDLNALVTYQNRLDNIYRNFLTNYDIILIVLDASIKNSVVTSIVEVKK